MSDETVRAPSCLSAAGLVLPLSMGIGAPPVHAQPYWQGPPKLKYTITDALGKLNWSKYQAYNIDTTSDEQAEPLDHDQSQFWSDPLYNVGAKFWLRYSIVTHAEPGAIVPAAGSVQLFLVNDKNVLDAKTDYIIKNSTLPRVAKIKLQGPGYKIETHPSDAKWLPRFVGGTSSDGFIFVAEEYN